MANSVWLRFRKWSKLYVLLLISVLAAIGWVIYLLQTPAASREPSTCALPDDSQSSKPGMVWIPDGQFLIGSSVYPEERPISVRSVKGFWMDRTEVTNAQFAEFVKATGYVTRAEMPVDTLKYPNMPLEMQKPGAVVFTMPTDFRSGGDLTQWWRYLPGASWRHPVGLGSGIEGKGSYPVVALTYEDALAYARWKGHDLPSEAEWEWAARAGQPSNTGTNSEPPTQANTWQGLFPVNNLVEDGFVGVAPVGCFQANAYGLFDMIGNVWELTRDIYFPFHVTDASNEAKPLVRMPGAGHLAAQHVIKGGSYLCAANYCKRYRAAARQGQDDDLAAGHIGFRTVLRATTNSP